MNTRRSAASPSLPDKILALHDALMKANLAHAFGGTLALAWCTQRARGTIDIDVNIFVPADRADDVLTALPDGVTRAEAEWRQLADDGQARLWWGGTPIDVFLDTTPFHDDIARRVRWETFGEHDLPFLACRDLAVFKAYGDRTRDLADLEEMQAAGTLDVEAVAGVLAHYLGAGDPRLARLLDIARA